MALTGRWAGRTWGIDIGSFYVVLEDENTALTGILSIW